ncbi:thiol-disulfide oxidoreductase DCC family protein [Pseudomonas boanensis]|uniref:thiol-disulfide oxidoreductase DCC family protein n=1 Tax=Metapseudomonas boanensis TaxID=2822138 RepID=UPI0035D43732
MATPKTTIKVFYDGACPRCIADRRWYEGLADASEGVEWVDITGREAQLRVIGIDPYLALTELHVQDEAGRIHRELDAYILLLARVPKFAPLAWLIGRPGLRPLLSHLYRRWVLRRLKRSGRL